MDTTTYDRPAPAYPPEWTHLIAAARTDPDGVRVDGRAASLAAEMGIGLGELRAWVLAEAHRAAVGLP